MATLNETFELVYDGAEGRDALEPEPHGLRVRFEFPWEWSPWEGWVQGTVVASEGNLRVEYCFVCLGWDMLSFAEEIRRFHTALEGEALFVNRGGNVELKMVVRDRGRGRITATLRLERAGADLRLHLPPPWIELDGFEIEQSYLPGMVEQIREFLDRTGISTDRNPSKGL